MLQVYKASAGSGKTFNLAKEYIKILLACKREDNTYRLRPLNSRPHEHVLAITFTNKATNEMTDRIIRELAKLAQVPGVYDGKLSDYHAPFVKEFACSDRQLVEASKYALFTLLSDYNYFNVSTIDSFFQNVLRIFTRELEIADDFNLELDDAYTITLGINEMFRSLNYVRGLSDSERRRVSQIKLWLREYMVANLTEGRVFNIFSKSAGLQKDIIKSLRGFMDERFKLNSARLRKYFDAETPDGKSKIMEFTNALRTAGEDIKSRLSAAAAQLLPWLGIKGVNGRVKGSFANYAEGKWGKDGPEYITAAKLALLDNPAGLFNKNVEPDPEVIRHYNDYIHLHMHLVSMYRSLGIMRRQVYNLGLLGCVLSFLERYCRDNNQILLSETNSLLHDFIKDDDTPFVYERLGYYLRHFLLDEFQDTSLMQWQNLKPLLMESLSHRENYDNLIIGDEKQCIYRFRNADPELLGHQVSAEVTGRYGSGAVMSRGVDVSENTNWRSSRDVIMFNNSLFTALAALLDNMSGYIDDNPKSNPAAVARYFAGVRNVSGNTPLSVREVYANVVQQVSPKHMSHRGYVRLAFMPEPDEDADGDGTQAEPAPVKDEVDESAGELYRAFASATVIAEIDRELAAGYRPADIAILVRTHSEGEFIIAELQRAIASETWRHGHVDIVSADAVGLNSSPTVRLIISVLRQYVNPMPLPGDDDDSREAEAGRKRRNLQQRITDLHNRFEYYRTDSDLTRTQALEMALRHERDEYADVDPVSLTADEIRARAEEAADMRCPSLVSLVERIIRRYVSPVACSRDAAFIMALQDIAIDYENTCGSDLRSFIEWWDRSGNRAALNSPAGVDAISVMTIHQSKGLEFKCVHLPFMNMALYENHSTYKPSVDWYDIDPSLFSEYISADILPPMMPLENSAGMAYTEAFGRTYADIVSRKRIDALNLVYVAMTRAIDELVICTGPSSSRSHDEDLCDYLRAAVGQFTTTAVADIARHSSGDIDRWLIPLAPAIDGDVVEIGVPRRPVVDSGNPVPGNPEPDSAAGKTADMSPGKLRMPGYKARDNDESVNVDDDFAGPFDYSDPRQRGILLHRVMQHVSTPDTLPLAMRRQAYRVHLDENAETCCLRLLGDVIDGVADRCWFAGNRRAVSERTLSINGRNYRPDRIVWKLDGSVDVIDYKFTEPPVSDEDATARHRRYCSQVRGYVQALGKTGMKNVNGYIWYIDEGNIVPV